MWIWVELGLIKSMTTTFAKLTALVAISVWSTVLYKEIYHPNYAALEAWARSQRSSKNSWSSVVVCVTACYQFAGPSRTRKSERENPGNPRNSGKHGGLFPEERTREHGVGFALGTEAALPGLRRVVGRLQGQSRRFELIPLPGKCGTYRQTKVLHSSYSMHLE